MDADGGELDGERAGRQYAALGRLDELRHVAVARVEGGIGVNEADDGLGERVVAVAERLDEDFAQKQREVWITCYMNVSVSVRPARSRVVSMGPLHHEKDQGAHR